MSLLLLSNIILMYQLFTFDLNNNSPSSGEIMKIPDKLKTKNELIYFSGITVDKSFVVNSAFSFNDDFPNEFYNGYLTPIKLNSGSYYYLWTSFKLENDFEIDGWFIAIPQLWEISYSEEPTKILFPVIKRNNK